MIHANSGGTKQTLCWSCGRATGRPDITCSWARHGDYSPVEDWDATPTTLSTPPVNSFIVHACPLFLPEPKRHMFVNMDADGTGEIVLKRDTGVGAWKNRKKRYVEHNNQWYTIEELMALTGKCGSSIYKLMQRGILNNTMSITRPDPNTCSGTSNMPEHKAKSERTYKNRNIWYVKVGREWYTLNEICDKFNVSRQQYYKRILRKIQSGALLGVKRVIRPSPSESGVEFDWSNDSDTTFEEIIERICQNCFLNV